MDIDLKKIELVRNAGHDSGEIDPGCLIGFYFAAHWFPAARVFLPKLTAAYTAINTPQKRLEIVFVSFDRNEDTFEAYSVDMPWLSVPFKNEALRINLAQKFQITDTFRLVITTPTLKVLSQNAINDIKTKAVQAYDYWETISGKVKSFADSPYCERNHIMAYIDMNTKSICAYCKIGEIAGWTCLECKMSTCMICQEHYSNSNVEQTYKIMCYKSHNMRQVTKINDYYSSRFSDSKYTCRTCNQNQNGTGLHCFPCVFDMCLNCAKSVCEDKYLALCPKGHEVLWEYGLCAKIYEKYGRYNFRCEICGESYMGGGAFACIACEYYVCVPCVKKANTNTIVV